VRPFHQNRVKKVGDMVQAVEHLPSKHKVLNSNPSTTKKRKKISHWIEIQSKSKIPTRYKISYWWFFILSKCASGSILDLLG
jgi:hypothetical protein